MTEISEIFWEGHPPEARKMTLREAMDAAGVSRSDLAGVFGLTPEAVRRWEAGIAYPELNKLDVLADVLHLDVQTLYNVLKYGITERPDT